MGHATAALAALLAVAAPTRGPDDSTAIVGGDATAACAWPTVVSLGRVCTGTLVHPQVVVYAAHCGDGFPSVEFGSAIASRHARTVATQRCETWPGGFLPGAGRDWAFCILASPQDDLPIVPPLMGCEVDALAPGVATTLVGFGESEFGYGDKRAVATTITQWSGDEIRLGGDGRDSCEGDSGGPAFVQLPGGQWRAFGIVSHGETCGEGGFVSLMHLATPWVEERSGFDLSPCFDADGIWRPTSDCAEFSAAPDDDRGNWGAGCDQPLEAVPSTCGSPFDAQGDRSPPSVEFLDPPESLEAGLHHFEVQAEDEGSGVHTLRISVDGLPVESGTAWSDDAGFDVTLSAGEHELRATATDHAGNRADAVLIVDVSGGSGGANPQGDANQGCGCRQSSAPSAPDLLVWGWMFSLGWRARRSGRTCYP